MSKKIVLSGTVSVPFFIITEIDDDICVNLDDEFAIENWSSFVKDRIGPRNVVLNEVVDVKIDDIDVLEKTE